jgi:hypothetical protein
MTDEETRIRLRTAADAEVSGHHLDPGVAATAWSAAQNRPRQLRLSVAIAATVVGVLVASAAVAFSRTSTPAGPPAGRPLAASACTENASTGELPTWARSGFTTGGVPPRHVIGDHHEIVAVHNKILWVARHGTGPLHVIAQLEGSSAKVTRTVALGPSYVDLPSAGCWLLTVQWSRHRDTLALRYLA